MRKKLATLCLLATLSGGALAQAAVSQSSGAPAPAAQTPPAPPKSHSKAGTQHALRRKKPPVKLAKPVPVAPVAPAVAPQVAPPVPATLMNQSPVAPTVTLQDGRLTIDAPNSMLSEVLNGVRNATGAVLEGPTPPERVAVRLGPGDPRQVIAALLQGAPYDYLILGSQENPEAVTRIMLTAQSQGSAPGTPPGAPSQAVGQPPSQESPAESFPNEGAVVSGTVIEGDQPPQPQVPQPPPPQPPQPQTLQPNSPEQLFRELQSGQQRQTPTQQ